MNHQNQIRETIKELKEQAATVRESVAVVKGLRSELATSRALVDELCNAYEAALARARWRWRSRRVGIGEIQASRITDGERKRRGKAVGDRLRAPSGAFRWEGRQLLLPEGDGEVRLPDLRQGRRSDSPAVPLTPTAQAMMDASGHQSVPMALPGKLPATVEDAQKKLVEALRKSQVSVYSLTYAGGDAEFSFEFTSKGTTKL